jgi:prephenate dehydrogenase
MLEPKKTDFGILGLGRFGQCLAKLLLPFGSVMAHDVSLRSSPIDDVPLVSLEEVARAEILFLLVPISSFRDCCQQVAKHVTPATLLVEACSVKVVPLQIMQEIFSPAQPLMATHPLFGPDSILDAGGVRDHKIVICTETHHALAQKMKALFQQIGLAIIFLSAEEHDTAMAHTQALAHFLGRVPMLSAPQELLSTPSFELLKNMAHLVAQDKEELFFDMHRYNPFTRLVREQLLEQLGALHQKLNHFSS